MWHVVGAFKKKAVPKPVHWLCIVEQQLSPNFISPFTVYIRDAQYFGAKYFSPLDKEP